MEGFRFQDVCLTAQGLQTRVDMVNPYVSSSDAGGFHLSVFTAHELCVELGILWVHQQLGLAEKSGEVWMRECSCKIRASVRAVRDIDVVMTCEAFRVVGPMAYLHSSFRISDTQGGLFLVEQRGGLQR